MSPYPLSLSNCDAYLEDARPVGTAGRLSTLILQPQYGFVPQTMQRGIPEIRDNSSKRPSQNGTFDFTQFFGASSVVMTIKLVPEVAAEANLTDEVLEDRLRAWMLPSVRAYLYFRPMPSGDYKRILVRPASFSPSQLSFVTNKDFRTVSLGLRGVTGAWEGPLLSESLEPGAAVEAGRTYDQTYDKVYAASSVIGAKPVVNSGNAPTFPLMQIFGPCTKPRVENQTSGIKLEFLSTFSLLAGEFLLIDFEEGTVLMNGDPTNSRYDKIDFAGGVSDWWELLPGTNYLRYYPLSSSSPSRAIFTWRSRYL